MAHLVTYHDNLGLVDPPVEFQQVYTLFMCQPGSYRLPISTVGGEHSPQLMFSLSLEGTLKFITSYNSIFVPVDFSEQLLYPIRIRSLLVMIGLNRKGC